MLPDAAATLWTRRLFWLLAGVLVFRVLHLFAAVDFQLSGDEAYYWDWGRRPDWGYYSKPPLIGWLMGVLRLIFGYQWWSVRLASILFGTTTLGILFLLGRRLFDARVGFFAALLFLLTPGNVAANFGFTIDSPLLLCWSAALLLFWKVAERPDSKGGWLALMLVIGVGTLAKQMMLVFPVLMILFTALSPADRSLLKRPMFWICLLGGLAFLTPVLWWNEHHGWITMKHTSEHFTRKELTVMGWLGQLLGFPLFQALMYAVITWGLMIAVLYGCSRRWTSLGRHERYLFVFSAPALGVFQLLAARQYINENWPAVFYLSAFVLAAGIASQQERLARWMHRGCVLGGVLALVIYAYIPAISLFGLTGKARFDPFVSMRGWVPSAQQIGLYLDRVPHPDRTFVLVLDHRHNASQMAFHLPQHPTVYRWTRQGKVESQYEIWPNAADKIGWDAFVIYPDSEDDGFKKNPLSGLIWHAFDSYEKLGDVEAPIGTHTKRSFQLYLCQCMKRWPNSEPATQP
jgi:4-amino-4-deoxy-L-arabinose transferase-like glycosyltransferase